MARESGPCQATNQCSSRAHTRGSTEIAVGLPGDPDLFRFSQWRDPASPSARNGHSARRPPSRFDRRDFETGSPPYPAPFVCNAYAGARIRYPHHPRTIRTPRCEYDHDLRPCLEPRRRWRSQPSRPLRTSGLAGFRYRVIKQPYCPSRRDSSILLDTSDGQHRRNTSSRKKMVDDDRENFRRNIPVCFAGK
jgi:hypothetical protein